MVVADLMNGGWNEESLSIRPSWVSIQKDAAQPQSRCALRKSGPSRDNAQAAKVI